jgi:hypothetical protein
MATRSYVRGNLVPDILVKPANAFICQVLNVTHAMTFKYFSAGKPHPIWKRVRLWVSR